MQRLLPATDPVEILPRLWRGIQGGGATAFYVGAHHGEHLEHMVEVAGFSRVFCFEPDTQAQARLRELSRTYPPFLGKVDVMSVAISDLDGDVELAHVYGPKGQPDQFVTPGTDGMEWSPASWDDPDEVRKARVRCHTITTLADTLGTPGFILVDTEGHEAKVLAGAAGMLSRTEATHRPGWLIEYHSPENKQACSKLLDAYGYEVETVYHPHYAQNSPMWYQHGWIKARPWRW